MSLKSKKRKALETFEVLTDTASFAYAEAFKTLRTNIEFVASDKSKVIMTLSTLAGEGKTTVSINLAIALAQSQKKVLLIDCDMRRPKVQRYLRIKHSSQYGLSTVLNGTSEYEQAIGLLDDLGIYIMLAGPTPPNPSELLSSDKCKEMFKNLSERFDYIICDTPPVSIVSDALVLSKNADGAIFVVRQDYTRTSQIKEVIEKLNTVDVKLLGSVLNNYDEKTASGYKYSYDKYYRYGSYYESTK